MELTGKPKPSTASGWVGFSALRAVEKARRSGASQGIRAAPLLPRSRLELPHLLFRGRQLAVNELARPASLSWSEPVRVMSDAHAQQRRESRRDRQVHNLPRRESRPPLSA